MGQLVKNCLQYGRHGFDPWVGKIPWRRIWQPTPVFLPGESPGTENPGGLQSLGLPRVRYDWAIKHTHTLRSIPWSLWNVLHCSLLALFSHTVVFLCDSMDCSAPDFLVLHYLPKFAQTHLHWVCHPTTSSSVAPLCSCPQSFPAKVFPNESALCIRWPQYWSFSFSISPSSEYSGLMFFKIDWLVLLAVQGTLKSLVIIFILKSVLFDMSIAAPIFFWFPFAWNIFSIPSLSVCVCP